MKSLASLKSKTVAGRRFVTLLLSLTLMQCQALRPVYAGMLSGSSEDFVQGVNRAFSSDLQKMTNLSQILGIKLQIGKSFRATSGDGLEYVVKEDDSPWKASGFRIIVASPGQNIMRIRFPLAHVFIKDLQHAKCILYGGVISGGGIEWRPVLGLGSGLTATRQSGDILITINITLDRTSGCLSSLSLMENGPGLTKGG